MKTIAPDVDRCRTAGSRVSVAIASYNGAAYIREQLESIARQTVLPDEVIVSDDASTDDTMRIVEDFAATAPFRVTTVKHAGNIGILENFYAAFAATGGDFIYYCDQDDVWEADKIERVQAAFADDVALVTHPSAIVDSDLNPMGRNEPMNRMIGRNAAPFDAANVRTFGHQVAFRRSVLNAMVALRPVAEAPGAERIGRNFDTYIPLCASLVGAAHVLDRPLTLFRRHATATSGAGGAVQHLTMRDRALRASTEGANIEDRLAIVKQAAALNIGIASLTHAMLLKKQRRAQTLGDLLNRPRLERLIRLPQLVATAARATGASNDPRSRNLAFATIAAVL